MPMVRDRCICLRKNPFSETSQVLSLFGREQGIVRVLAKGAHRRTKAGASKFDGGVDLLDIGEAVFTNSPEKELGTLCEWSLREGHPPLRKDLRAMYLGLYAAELVGTLFEQHDAHADLFDRFEATLNGLCGKNIEAVFLSFELDLLREAGYLPQMSACISCGRETMGDRAFFSARSGGIVCRNCEGSTPDRIEIDVRLVRLVQSVLKLPRANGSPQRLPQLTRHQTDPVNRILVQHVQHTLSKKLRMGSYVV